MPQILIREKDYTRPGLGEYSNYAVVVPGFVSEDCEIENVFDENGICEISSQSEFRTKIGKVAPKRLIAGKKTVTDIVPNYGYQKQLKIVIANDHIDGEHNYELLIKSSNAETNTVLDTTLAHIEVVNESGDILVKPSTTNEDGYFVFDNITVGAGDTTEFSINSLDYAQDTTKYGYIFEVKDLGVAGPAVQSEEGEEEENNDETIDEATHTWQYTIDSDVYTPVAYDATVSTWLGAQVLSNSTVETEIPVSEVPAHYGNQEAYMLLGLGFPVVYVNMGKFYSDIDHQETMKEAIDKLGTDEFWEGLRDKATYDYRFVVTGLLDSTAKFVYNEDQTETLTGSELIAASQAIARLVAFSADNGGEGDAASVRGDATALLDVDETAIELYAKGNTTSTSIITSIREAIKATPVAHGQYSSFFTPSVCYAGIAEKEYNFNNKLPASFHYLACFIYSIQQGNPEWFAAAGMTRGLCGLTVEGTTYKLGEIAINALEPRSVQLSNGGSTPCRVSCNVIAKVRNVYYLWGNRTAYELGITGSANGDLVASHFLNIRQLCTTIKKQVYTACRRYTFDPNSDILWINFCNSIKPTLEKMKANQGIGDYKIIQVASNQKAKLKARIRIIPIEAVEDFDIEVSLEDSFGDVSATITE